MNQARKRTGTKKVLSMILVLVMLLSLLSMAAFTLPASETGNSKNSYDYNIMFLDCGRKYFSVDSIKQIIDNASAAGFNYIQLAVGNDGLRFLLNDMSLTVNGKTYTSKQVSDAIHTGNTDYNATFEEAVTQDTKKACPYNPTTNELTESEMNTIITYAKAKGMGVIPCVNTPGHMDAILSAATSLTGTNCSYNGSVRTIDVTNDTAVAFTKALLQKYITYFANNGCQLFNMGADEYANDIYTGGSMGFGNLQREGNYSYYVTYVNQVAKMIKDAGMTPMAFNDGIYFNGNISSGTFDTDIIICYWSSGWSGYSPMSASELASKGFRLVNTNGSYYWVLGKNDKCSASKASGFNKNSFPDKAGNSIISNPAGSMFCIWSDYPGAESEADVISKTAATIRDFGAALPKVTSGTVTPTPTTPTPDTSTSAKDIYVAVNGTATETVSGTYSGPYTTDDTSIATVTTNATTTERKLTAVTSIESGHQYLIVNNRRDESKKGNLLTTQTSNWYGNSGLKLTGEASTTSTELWTIQESGSGYKVMRGSNCLTIGENTASVQSDSAVLTLSYNTSGGYWNISQNSCYLNNLGNSETAGGWKWENNNNAPTDGGSKWTIYEITGGEQTEITFHGVAVGTTSVTIGGVTYTIHVTKELPANALTADTITLEHWITNAKVTSESGGSNNLQTISREYTGVQTEDGVAVDSLAYTPVGYWEATQVYFWKGVRLDSEHKQTNENGIDMTAEGTDITHIRYLDGAWQYKTADDAWHYFVNTDQLVAYYLQKTTVTKEVETYVKDWGFGTSGTTDYNNEGQVALTVAVVYPDGTVSPAESGMYANSTTIFNYWNNRDIGIIAPKNNSDYNISKITVTDGARKENTSANQWYNSDTITWNKKTTAAGGQWYDETKVWDKSDGTTPMVNGKTSNITWSDKNTAKLVLIYLEPVVKNTNLNIVYWDDTANKQINPNPIQIAMTFNQGDTEPTYTTALRDAKGNVIGGKGSWNSNEVGNANYLPDDAYVVNSSNVHQTISKDMTQIEGIAGNYTSGLYEYRSADISTDGKTLTLHYGLKNTGIKTYVVDFGLPVTIPLSDLGITNLDTISWISLKQEDQECLTDHGTYGAATIDKNNLTVTYTLDQTLDNEIAIPINIKFSNNDQIYSYSFHVIPATSVYYEDSFAAFNGSWERAGQTEADAVQHLDELGKAGANNYGYDAKYNNSSSFSLGSAMKTTVSSTTNSNPPTATFTFKGTGFDLVSMTSKDTGTILVDVNGTTENGVQVTKHWIVDTFYGYTRTQQGYIEYTWTKGSDGTWHNKAIVIPDPPEGVTIGGTPTNSGDKTYEPNYIWTPAGEGDNALYQIPVIHYTDLPYGTYEVTVTPKYSSKRDPYYQADGNNNSYDFYLDGVRIYNPAGDKLNSQYIKDGEGYAQFTEIRNMLLNASGLTANIQSTTGMVFVDGVGTNGQLADYTNHGPNNEVYLSRNQAIAFKISDMSNVDSIQIGAKAPNGNATMQIKVGTNELQVQNLTTASDMYYKLNNVQANQTIVITNTSDSLLSLTTLKVTYKTDPSASNSADPVVDEEVVAQAPVMLMSMLYGEPQTFEPEHFTAKWSRNVRKGGTATLTVKASADVEAITVNGEEITAYTTKTARSFWGSKETYHVFTYRVTNAVTADYSVCALNADGVASDPITAPLTVRPSIRDWWNGIFNKWKH